MTTNPLPSNQTQPKHSFFSKWSRHQVQRAIGNATVTSIYLENLPREWSAIQTYQHLSRLGKVVDVFIPSKTNRSGYRFGFVRFRSGGDTRRIIADLNKFQVRGGTLRAILARDRTHKPKPAPPLQMQKTAQMAPDQTFVNVVERSGAAIIAPCQPQPGIVFSPTQNTLSWLTRCAFGVLRNPQDTHAILKLFTLHGGPEVNISQVGGDSVLICFPSAASMSQFCQEDLEWVKNCFRCLEPWKQGLDPVNRLCWVTIRGIPLHAWCREFFSLVALFVGDLVAVAEETQNRQRLDYARLQIMTCSPNPITKTVPVTIAGRSFSLFIQESPPCSGLGTALAASSLPITSPETSTRRGDGSERIPAGKPFTDDPAELVEESVVESQNPFELKAIIRDCEINGRILEENKGVGNNHSIDLDPSPLSPFSAPRYHYDGDLELVDRGLAKPIKVFNSFGPLVDYVDSESNWTVKSTTPTVQQVTWGDSARRSQCRSISDSSKPISEFSPCSSQADTEAQEKALSLAIQQRRVTLRRKPTDRDDDSVWASSSGGDHRSASPRSTGSVERGSSFLSITELEARETLQVGQILGWDISKDPSSVHKSAVSMIEREERDWSLIHSHV
ncbi:hypothetical protein Tsubulata_027105 [Turnera subulata]|uniref:RRM domain-containing protein n=1 Tax=Turnera subulata TaxID=218843 RepID=A0A9Q0JJN4_9ROSI|nr:hypothetical protein Tsubulata_027105 [Turnera subulata]